MEVQNNNVTIQISAKDLSGRTLRVCDCDIFIVHVFTDNPSFYLSYSGREMLATEFSDELTIPKRDMENLPSGVVQYTYHYLPKTEGYIPNYGDESLEPVHCPHLHHPHHHPHKPEDFMDDSLINSKPVVTQIYWRNIKLHHPHDPHHKHPDMGMNEIGRVHRLLDIEIMNRIKDNESITTKLNEEIERSTKEDERLADLIEEVKEATDAFINDSDKEGEEMAGKLKDAIKSVEEETSRAVKAEAELEIKIRQEETARIGADEILDSKIVMERERAQANETNLTDRITSVSEKFESFKAIQTDALNTEIVRAKTTESALNDKIQGVVADLQTEVSRSAQKDIEHKDLVETESNRAKAVENKIATDLETEANRAKDAEKHIIDEVHGVQEVVSNLATATNVYTKAEVDTKISSVNNDIDTVNNWIGNHTNDVEALNTKVNGIVSDVDKAKADILAEVAKCDAENDKLATELKTLSDSTYTKAETDTMVNGINTSISALENWKQNHSDNTEGLNEKVNKLVADTEKLNADLLTETTNRVNADTTIQTKVDVTEGKVDSEIERAKAQEILIEGKIDEFKANAEAKHAELSDSVAEANANLTLEIARAKAAEKVISDAVEIINGDVETSGSIKKSLADGKAYTDAEIAKLSLQKDGEIADTLKAYATKDDVDKKISDVIGTAPEALDTLGKISNALSQDNDAIAAINEVLSGKANAEDVYTKNEVDTKVTAITNSVSTLETKVDNADTTINGRIDDLAVKVSAAEANADTSSAALAEAIAAEETARKAADKTISDKVDSEVEKLTEKVNDLTAKVIQDIADSTAKDTEIDANISALQTLLANVETKADNEVLRATEKDNELVAKDTELDARITANALSIDSEIARSKQVEKELNDKINSIEIPTVDFTEVNTSISTLSDKIESEKSRAAQAEKLLSDRLDAIVIPETDLTPIINAVSTLDTKVDNEISRATNAEGINAGNIAALQSSVSGLNGSVASLNASLTQLQADSSAKDSELENSISVEKNRAENAEKSLSDKIDIINGDKETVGSIAHAVEDAKHHIDDKLGDYYTKQEVNKAIEDVDVSGQLKDYATKKEVEDAIDSIDVTEQLKDYVLKSEASTIVDENGKPLNIVIDMSENDDVAASLYNKSECDSKFATKEELQAAVDNIVVGGDGEVNLSNFYSKSEVQNLLSERALKSTVLMMQDDLDSIDSTLATVQSAVGAINSEIAEINNTLSDVATNDALGEVENMVSTKASKSEVYKKTETYTKDEVNDLISGIIKTYTAEEYEALTDEEKNNGLIIVI